MCPEATSQLRLMPPATINAYLYALIVYPELCCWKFIGWRVLQAKWKGKAPENRRKLKHADLHGTLNAVGGDTVVAHA